MLVYNKKVDYWLLAFFKKNIDQICYFYDYLSIFV